MRKYEMMMTQHRCSNIKALSLLTFYQLFETCTFDISPDERGIRCKHDTLIIAASIGLGFGWLCLLGLRLRGFGRAANEAAIWQFTEVEAIVLSIGSHSKISQVALGVYSNNSAKEYVNLCKVEIQRQSMYIPTNPRKDRSSQISKRASFDHERCSRRRIQRVSSLCPSQRHRRGETQHVSRASPDFFLPRRDWVE